MVSEKKEYLELLCDAGNMFALLSGVSSTQNVLQRCVSLVAKHLGAEVCSIYLLDTAMKKLILRATTGLNPASVNTIQMNVGEGLVGKAMQEMLPVIEDNASRNPNFKYFPDANEESFECFMAIPILRGTERIGVLVVQRRQPHKFSTDEAMVLRSIASQLAIVIGNARMLLSLTEKDGPEKPTVPALPKIIPARVASRGLALGKAIIAEQNPILEMLRGDTNLPEPTSHTAGNNETLRLENAIDLTIRQIEDMERQISKRLPEAVTLIFDAHIMILKDKGFSGRMLELTRQGTSALRAVMETARHYIHLFRSSKNDYLHEKVADVEDITLRLMEHLDDTAGQEGAGHEKGIYIARDLLPSDVVTLSVRETAGIVLTGGGITSHAAILARSLQIPMLIVDAAGLQFLPDKTTLILDAEVGNLYVDPETKIIQQFRERIQAGQSLEPVPDTPDSLLKGVTLMANINLLSELDLAIRLKASGIGLYRSEFPFLVRNSLPSEAEQARIYAILFSTMKDREVTIRTLDVGGDKLLSYFDNAGEANPELGLRSIRFSFRYPEVFEEQIRAILISAGNADLRIMFPMISSLDEFSRARETVVRCFDGLRRQNRAPARMPRIGMMIELPSVLEVLEEFIMEADFFSIGTNDFVQYMLAADRTNTRVVDYYCPWHPSVLRALARIAEGVLGSNKDLSVCGEMAKEKDFIPFFMGIGIRKLSVDPLHLTSVRKCVANWSLEGAQRYTKLLLRESTVSGTRRVIDAQRLSGPE
ncbi:MAG: phosphoenolpyruvate--protein phosphotransferase [Pseudomonadota bacterium]